MSRIDCLNCIDGKENRCDGCNLYKISLNINEIMDTLMKHTPTKPNWVYDDEPLCPYCQSVLDEYEEVCEECTQLIDWSELTDWSEADR